MQDISIYTSERLIIVLRTVEGGLENFVFQPKVGRQLSNKKGVLIFWTRKPDFDGETNNLGEGKSTSENVQLYRRRRHFGDLCPEDVTKLVS